MARIDAFLELGRQQGCSDIHLAVGVPPMIRLHGVLEAIKYRQLTAEEMIELVSEILSKDQLKKFENGQDLDIAYESGEAGGRFRVNLFHKISGIGGVFRVIPPRAPTLKDLGLPKGCLVAIIVRGQTIVIPRGDDHIEAGDEVIVFALPEAIAEVQGIFD